MEHRVSQLKAAPFGIDVQGCASHQADLAELARHHGSMGGARAGDGQHPGRGIQRGNIACLCARTHQHHGGSRGGARGGVGRIQGDDAARHARAGAGSFRQRPGRGAVGTGQAHGAQILRRERLGARQGLGGGDEPFVEQIQCNAGRCQRRALAVARLQQKEMAILHRELEVLHVAHQVFERMGGSLQLAPGLRHELCHAFVPVGIAAARHHVLALGIAQKVDPRRGLAGARVAREPHPGARTAPGIAKHHALDRHGRAQIVRNRVERPVGAGLVGIPGAEHRFHRALQLLMRVLRERLSRRIGIAHQKQAGQCAQLDEVQHALVAAVADLLQLALEQLRRQPLHHLAIGGDQAAVGIPDQPRMPGLPQEAGQRGIAQPHIEERLHHARHGHGGA